MGAVRAQPVSRRLSTRGGVGGADGGAVTPVVDARVGWGCELVVDIAPEATARPVADRSRRPGDLGGDGRDVAGPTVAAAQPTSARPAYPR
ncbi:hypothetical protein GCM10027047_16190 [Rhodococcus aerolatus]